MSRHLPPPDECANCGAEIPRNARACPECGADERTGWRENSIYDGLDLPGGDDDAPPTPGGRRGHQGGLAWYWIAAFILVLATLVLTAFGLRS